ncbi:MAG: hypothetical protein C4562_00975 [Actinobacteria bacterium]|nr:MAG: hypothetical protein C4562_00975 [Actinomycetota bacterium]
MDKTTSDSISLSVPLNENYASVLRLAVASVAARMNFTWDKIEDLKMAIAEAFLLSFRSDDNSEFNLDFNLFSDRLEILVKKSNVEAVQDSMEKKYSVFILTGLMDKVDIKPKGNNKYDIKLVKNLW